MIPNYHMHTTFSDGRDTPGAYIKQAIAKGMHAIGFSDHAPLPDYPEFESAINKFHHYTSLIREYQHTYQGILEIYAGLEVDYIPGMIHPHSAMIRGLDLDYTIGAVHYAGSFPDGRLWNVDGTAKGFEWGLMDIYSGNIKTAVKRYYHLMQEMLEVAPPTILAHMDRIKKHNQNGRYFSEREHWYRAIVYETLERISEKQVILEVNTKGFYSYGESDFYPGLWILKAAREMGIPVHLASDAHHPKYLQEAFTPALKAIKAAGYDAIRVLEQGEWVDLHFEIFASKIHHQPQNISSAN